MIVCVCTFIIILLYVVGRQIIPAYPADHFNIKRRCDLWGGYSQNDIPAAYPRTRKPAGDVHELGSYTHDLAAHQRRHQEIDMLYKQKNSRVWWAKYRDADGVVRRRSTGCRDRGAARSVVNRWREEVERIKSGVISAPEATAAKHAAQPVGEHLTDYEAALRATGTAYHAKLTVTRCRRVCEDLGVRSLRDLTPGGVNRWFVGRRAEGMGAVTGNHYATALRMWFNWLRRNGRLTGDGPEAGILRFKARAERRHIRRALREEEAPALVRAASLRPLADRGRERVKKVGNKRSNWGYATLTPDTLEASATRARAKLSPLVVRRLEAEGEARAMFYRAALGSGFRAGELAAMLVSDFDAQAGTFRLDAGDEKAGRGVEGQPIPPELVADLAAWVAARRARPGDRLFPAPATLKAFNLDLVAAGIDKHDERGRVLDIHSLRKTYITWLQRAGASLKEAQHLARHTSVELTANDYTDPTLLNMSGRVAAMPSTRPQAASGASEQQAAGAETDPTATMPKTMP